MKDVRLKTGAPRAKSHEPRQTQPPMGERILLHCWRINRGRSYNIVFFLCRPNSRTIRMETSIFFGLPQPWTNSVYTNARSTSKPSKDPKLRLESGGGVSCIHH